jgi:hypothetical protein
MGIGLPSCTRGETHLPEDSYDYKIDKYVKILKDNWISTFGTLLRLPKGTLEKLHLPIALCVELERLQDLPNNYMLLQYIHVDEVRVKTTRSYLPVNNLRPTLRD